MSSILSAPRVATGDSFLLGFELLEWIVKFICIYLNGLVYLSQELLGIEPVTFCVGSSCSNTKWWPFFQNMFDMLWVSSSTILWGVIFDKKFPFLEFILLDSLGNFLLAKHIEFRGIWSLSHQYLTFYLLTYGVIKFSGQLTINK